MTYEIKVPHEIVNDDVVTISQWNFENGDKVRPQDIVVLIETSKAVIEVEAGAEGYIDIAHPQNSEVGVGSVIGVILEQRPKSNALGAERNANDASQVSNKLPEPSQRSERGTSFSRKARLLMEENGLVSQNFAGLGLVREKDVVNYLQAHKQVEKSADQRELVRGDGGANVVEKTPGRDDDRSVGLWSDAHLAAKDRERSLAWLAFNYVWRTWFLSNLVRWAPRFIILQLHRWRGVEIGSGCFIDPTAVIETAHAHNITIGNDVRIAAQVAIMTHIKPPHLLRARGIMESTIGEVRLEDSCFIGVGAIIMPGVTVGRAAVVASGAVVLGDIPAYSMVAGNPAKVVKRFSSAE